MNVVKLDDPDYELYIGDEGDFLRWRSRARKKEPYTFDWVKTIGKGTLYDVGACVGSYSLMAAARGAKVVAIEPLEINARECVENAKLNRLALKVVMCAAGSYDGNITLWQGEPMKGYGLASTSKNEEVRPYSSEVPVRKLDTLAKEIGFPTHLKVDVEDAEMDVLRGASEVLDRVESVIIEAQTVDEEASVRAVLEPHGLVHTWVGGNRKDSGRMHIFRREH